MKSSDDHRTDTNFGVNEDGLPSSTPTEIDATLTVLDQQQTTHHVAAGSAVDGGIFYNCDEEASNANAINTATSDSLHIPGNVVVAGKGTEQNTTITTTVDVSEDQTQPSSPLPLRPPTPLQNEESAANLTSIVESVVAKIDEEEHNVEIDGTMIAEAAAAAVAAVGDVQLAVDAALAADRHDEGATAAAVAAVAAAQANEISDATIAVGNESEIDADVKKNEQRRKRYREKSVEEDYLQPEKKLKKKWETRDEELASRRLKDRERYAGMTPDQREEYNKKRREQYHKQSEISRQRRRERERERYHSLENDDAKNRNTRRAKLERERYQKLNQEQLEAKNSRRRERAAAARAKKAQDRNNEEDTNNGTAAATTTTISPPDATHVGHSADSVATAIAVDKDVADADAATTTDTKAGVILECKVDKPESNGAAEKAAMDEAAGTVTNQNTFV